jgi:hypothetical protein
MASSRDEQAEQPRKEIADPWEDPDDEYAVLVDLTVPEAQQRFYSGSSDWSALDTKALGILAVAAAAIAILVTVHEDVNRFWWIPAVILTVAGGFLIAAIWPRDFYFGPDLLDFHDEMRDLSPLDAARELLYELVDATRKNDENLTSKTILFWWGLGVLSVGLVACLPITLLRPG